MQEVCPAHDADQLAAFNYEQAFDAVALHQVNRLRDRGSRRDGHKLRCHELLDLAASRLNVFVGEAAGTNQKLDPAWPSAFRSEFAATQEIPLGHNPDELAFGIHDR